MSDKEEMVEDRHYLLKKDPKTGKEYVVCERTYHPKSKNPYSPWKDKVSMEIAKEAGWPEIPVRDVLKYMDKLIEEMGLPPKSYEELRRIRAEQMDPTP